jgi:putative SOS response-associated peptidase YedK
VLPAVNVLTTTPNQLLSSVHTRMPVILPASSWSRWLNPDASGDDVAELLRPCSDEWLTVRPISTRINNVAYDRPDVIEPVDA